MKEFEVTVTVRNNRLKERRDALGLTRTALALKAGIEKGQYGRLEKMLEAPISKRTNAWRPCVLKLATFFKAKPDDLFPPAVFDVQEPESTFLADGEELVRLSALSGKAAIGLPPDPETKMVMDQTTQTLEKLLGTIPTREREVLRKRFGLDGPEMTLEEVAATTESLYGGRGSITRESVRSLETRALKRLRHPSRRDMLVEVVPDEDVKA